MQRIRRRLRATIGGALRIIDSEDPRRYGLLAGVLCLSVSLPWPLVRISMSAGRVRDAFDVIVLVSWLTAVALPLLPWRRFPRWVSVTPPLWGFAMLGGLVGAWAGLLLRYLLVVVMGFVYWGLTQPPGRSALLALPSGVLLATAYLGNESAATGVDLLEAVVLSAVIGEVLALLVGRQVQTRRALSGLLTAGRELAEASEETQVVEVVRRQLGGLLCADAVHVLRDHADVPAEPMFTVENVDRFGDVGMQSCLWTPVPGLGAVAVLWRTRRRSLSSLDDLIMQTLIQQLQPVLQQLRLVDRLRTAALVDPLTGVANRRALTDALATRTGGHVALLDLDHFKQVNDIHGHQHGDRVLQAFADLLADHREPGDLVARYGGEEFVWLQGDSTTDSAGTRLDAFRRDWAFRSGGLTVSVGLARRDPGESPDQVLRRADEALYAAKHGGRDQVAVADPPRHHHQIPQDR